MPTPAERSALLFVAAVAALGLGVRGCRALSSAAPAAEDREALAAQIAAVDSAVAERGRRPPRRAERPSGRTAERTPERSTERSTAPPSAPAERGRAAEPSGPVDPDRASAEELDRLPGIGPALAARIVASRDSAGPFGSLEGLQRVRGIGPALAAKIAPHVTFSGRSPPLPR